MQRRTASAGGGGDEVAPAPLQDDACDLWEEVADGIEEHVEECDSSSSSGADHEFNFERELEEAMAAEDLGDGEHNADAAASQEPSGARDASPPAEAELGDGVVAEAVAAEGANDGALPAGTVVADDGSFNMSSMGYVIANLAPHNGALVGLVGEYRCGKKAFANCHLHPHCAVQVGIARKGVDPMKLARWLTLGVPSKGQQQEERARLGRAHRALWSRDGPLGGASASSSDAADSGVRR